MGRQRPQSIMRCFAREVAFIADYVDFFPSSVESRLGLVHDKLSYIGANGIGSNLFCRTATYEMEWLSTARANKVVISPYWLLFVLPFIILTYYLRPPPRSLVLLSSVYPGSQTLASRGENGAFGAESLKIYEPWATDNWRVARRSGNR